MPGNISIKSVVDNIDSAVNTTIRRMKRSTDNIIKKLGDKNQR